MSMAEVPGFLYRVGAVPSAFDSTGVCALATPRGWAAHESLLVLGQGRSQGPQGGSGRLVGHVATDQAERSQEREAFELALVIFSSGSQHRLAHRVVGEQESIELLVYHRRGLRPQHDTRSALSGLDLVEGRFQFPATVIERTELGSWGFIRIEKRGDKAVGFGFCGPANAVDHLILNHPDSVAWDLEEARGGVSFLPSVFPPSPDPRADDYSGFPLIPLIGNCNSLVRREVA